MTALDSFWQLITANDSLHLMITFDSSWKLLTHGPGPELDNIYLFSVYTNKTEDIISVPGGNNMKKLTLNVEKYQDKWSLRQYGESYFLYCLVWFFLWKLSSVKLEQIKIYSFQKTLWRGQLVFSEILIFGWYSDIRQC